MEHVFDYTAALHNTMSMVSGGGYLISMPPANNQCGHGFYQFSPELFFSVLNRKNGFRVLDMTAIVEKNTFYGTKTRYYRLKDNTKTGERLMLQTSCRTYLLVLAKRVGAIPKNGLVVQQSDYLPLWDQKEMPCRHKSIFRQVLKRSKVFYKLGVHYLEWHEKRGVSKFAFEYDIDRELREYGKKK